MRYDENNKLEFLTPEMEARLPEFRDFGIKIGLSTERSDRDAGTAAIKKHYKACGLAEPEVKWFDSPWASVWASVWDSVRDSVVASVWDSVVASIGDSVRYSVRYSVWASVWASVGASVRASVGASVGASVRASVEDSVGDSIGDSVRYSVGAHYDADDSAWFLAWDQYGISLPPEALTMIEVSNHVWWYYPGKDVVFASDRPTSLKFDSDGVLHCETGKSIEFLDGNGVSSWHGQIIPDEWVTGRPPSPTEALTWENMDQRAAACEIIGWHHILDILNAKTIDDSRDPIWGKLVEVYIPDSGPEKFLDVMCATGRRFALMVPNHVITVDQAQSELHGGLPPEILRFAHERT